MNSINKNSGFTLIELLVVVLIIGILAAIALPQYTKSVEKSRASEALVLVKAIASAADRYFLAEGKYTDDMNDLDIDIPGTASTLTAVDGKNRKVTKMFDCGTRNTFKGVANRIPVTTKYFIAMTLDNKLVCGSYATQYNSVCVSLGGKSIDKSNCLGNTCYQIQ